MAQDVPARFGRTADLYGEDGFARLRRARVAVAGLGGVGAHAAVALARSGVGALLLIDFDVVTASSLNRSPAAGPDDLGRPKVEVVAGHLRRTCPDTEVLTSREFIDAAAAPVLLPAADPPAAVVDAIDSLNPKVALLAHCALAGLPVFSSMGAAGRRDPTALATGDIAESEVCPLARKVRGRLRRQGVARGIRCVWSREPPAGALPADLGDLTSDRGRVRNRLPSQMSLPGMFGYALAALVLEHLAGEPDQDPPA